MNVSTNQQLSNSGSQSNLLDFLGQESMHSQKVIDNFGIQKNEQQQKKEKEKGGKKKFFIARKVQPQIERIEEDYESDMTSQQGQNQKYQHNASNTNVQYRRNLSVAASVKNLNESQHESPQRYSSQDNKQPFFEGQEQEAAPLALPNLNNMTSINQSLNNSQYVPGYTPQNNPDSNQIAHKRDKSPTFIGKSNLDKPSAFQTYLHKEQNDALSSILRSNNLNDSMNQHVNISAIDDSMDIPNAQKDKNIFLKHNQPNYQIQIGEFGPKYDKNGKIIPRSIVGKPEWFLKNQGSRLTKEDLSIFTPKKARQLTNQSISVKSRSLTKANLKNAQKILQDVKITKFQLEKELDVIRMRIKSNVEAEKKAIDQLKTNDYLRYTQQTRNIEKYQNVEKYWQDFIENSSALLRRDYTQSQLLSQDVYRQKREMTDVFETAKGAFDLFGNRVWYMNLRNPVEEQQLNQDEGDYQDMIRQKLAFNPNPLVVLEDIPLAFNRALPQGMIKKQLEIIRKPLATSLNQSLKMSKSISQSSINQSGLHKPFQSFDSLKYYNKRLVDLREDLKFHKKVLIDQNMELDNLAVIGQSQLQREQDMLYSSPQELFDHKKPDPEPYVEEVIEMNYTKQGIQNEGTLKDFSLPRINRSSLDYSVLSKI